jgi:hypothetical protein
VRYTRLFALDRPPETAAAAAAYRRYGDDLVVGANASVGVRA